MQRLQVTDSIYLSPVVRSDKAAYMRHFTDPLIARNLMRVPFPYTDADAEWWLDHRAANARDPETHFAIRRGDGFLVGGIGLVSELVAGAHAAECGYWLAKEHRGQGLMAQILPVFARHAFDRLGLHRLQASIFPFNDASGRALEKAGFTREGTMRHLHRKGDEFIDGVVFSLLSTDLR